MNENDPQYAELMRLVDDLDQGEQPDGEFMVQAAAYVLYTSAYEQEGLALIKAVLYAGLGKFDEAIHQLNVKALSEGNDSEMLTLLALIKNGDFAGAAASLLKCAVERAKADSNGVFPSPFKDGTRMPFTLPPFPKRTSRVRGATPREGSPSNNGNSASRRQTSPNSKPSSPGGDGPFGGPKQEQETSYYDQAQGGDPHTGNDHHENSEPTPEWGQQRRSVPTPPRRQRPPQPEVESLVGEDVAPGEAFEEEPSTRGRRVRNRKV